MIISSASLSWLLLLLLSELMAVAEATTFCSTANTADSSPESSIYASRGLCADKCRGSWAYAVTQNDKCWCTNQMPSSSTSDDKCNKPCPGYPAEMCGGETQFTYILLDTSLASSSDLSPSPAPVVSSLPTENSSPPTPATVTVVETSAPDSKTIYKTIQAPAPSTSAAGTGAMTFHTVTITPTNTRVSEVPNSKTSADSANHKTGDVDEDSNTTGNKKLKEGGIIGVSVGTSAALLFLGIGTFTLWRRRRRLRDEDSQASEDGVDGQADERRRRDFFGAPFEQVAATSGPGIKRDNTSASADSRMGAFGQNHNMWRNSTGSLEDSSSEANQVLRVVNPDVPEKMK